MKLARIEIQVDNPEKAMSFYRDVFGWRFEKANSLVPYWNIFGDDGFEGGLLQRNMPASGIGAFVCVFEVDSLDKMSLRIEAHGGSMITKKMSVEDIGWKIYFKDPDGNVFCLLERDTEARDPYDIKNLGPL